MSVLLNGCLDYFEIVMEFYLNLVISLYLFILIFICNEQLLCKLVHWQPDRQAVAILMLHEGR